MKRIMSEAPQAEFGGIFKVKNQTQLPHFEWPLHRETGVQRFMWLIKIQEFLYNLSKGTAEGREVYRKYGGG